MSNMIETRAWDIQIGDEIGTFVVTDVDVDPFGRSGRQVRLTFACGNTAVLPLNLPVQITGNTEDPHRVSGLHA